MEEKRRLLILSYDSYKAVLRFRAPYWATAAGYAMADLFYEYFQESMRVPLPENLTPNERDGYRQEVRTLVVGNLRKAHGGHVKNVDLSDAYGVSTEWSRASEARVRELDLAIAAQPAISSP